MNSRPITLVVAGHGHVPSFKNSKMVVRNRPLTKPEYQKWMAAVVDDFASQLRSSFQTKGTEIMTVQQRLSLIASWLPLDDSRKWIPEHSVRSLEVPRGREGAIVRIERVGTHHAIDIV